MLEPGSELCGFRIERLLGRGGMGEVYEAHQLTLDRVVALKVLGSSLVADAGFRARFRREGQRQATLDHPNVVTVYEAGEFDDGLYLAMRLVRGVTLKQLIGGGEIDPARALALLTPVAAALDAAHALGLVHRDVKPQNILVREDDHPFLADFGLTRDVQDTALTGTGQFVGTIDYIAPEVLRGEPAGPAADVYALAGVLYECLTGQVPFPRPSEASVLYAHVHDAPPAATIVRHDLPAAIDEVLSDGMAKEPEDRSPSAGVLLARAAAALGPGRSASLARAVVPEDPVDRGLRPVVGDTEEGSLPVAAATPATQAGRTPATQAARASATQSSRVRPRRPLAAVLGSLAAVALVAVAYAVGHSGSVSPTAAPLSTTASSAVVSLSAPAGWSRLASDTAPAVPGLTLREPVSLQASGLAASGVLAGVAAGSGPTLLPVSLRRRVEGALPAPKAVVLGDAEALRYANVHVRGFDRALTLHAIPAGDSSVIVACYAPDELAQRFSTACARVAGSVAVLRGSTRSLGGDAADAKRLESAVATYGRLRTARRLDLERAGSAKGQAAAATSLRRIALDTAGRIARVGGGAVAAPGRAAASSALRAVGADYGALARAAGAGHAGAYDRARSKVGGAESAATDSLRALAARLANGVGPL